MESILDGRDEILMDNYLKSLKSLIRAKILLFEIKHNVMVIGMDYDKIGFAIDVDSDFCKI